jgi:hypothetical protein
MYMVRNTLLILFAAFIDLLQAGISAGLFVIGAFPGTVAGSAAGCIIGRSIAGSVGCWIGGAVAGAAGSAANGAAAATLPIAVGLGMAVNFCLDITLGLILTLFLLWLGMYHKGYGIGGFLVELIPGLDNLPGWTIMTALCVVRKTAEEKKLVGSTGSMFSTLTTTGVAGATAFTAFAINKGTQRIARDQGLYTKEEQDQRLEEKQKFVSTELKNIDGIRAKNNATYAA